MSSPSGKSITAASPWLTSRNVMRSSPCGDSRARRLVSAPAKSTSSTAAIASLARVPGTTIDMIAPNVSSTPSTASSGGIERPISIAPSASHAPTKPRQVQSSTNAVGAEAAGNSAAIIACTVATAERALRRSVTERCSPRPRRAAHPRSTRARAARSRSKRAPIHAPASRG